MKRENRLKIGGFSVFGGETGIRTPDTVVAVYTISNRAPSTSSDISPKVNIGIIPAFPQKIKAFFHTPQDIVKSADEKAKAANRITSNIRFRTGWHTSHDARFYPGCSPRTGRSAVCPV